VSVSEAVLSFYVFDQGTALGSGDPVNAPKSVYKIVEPWKATSITWLNAPKFDSTNAVASSNNTQTKVWEDYNVTTVIKDIIESGSENYGFMLKFTEENDYKGARIYSSDCAEENKTLRPKLTITYYNTGIIQQKIQGKIIHAEEYNINIYDLQGKIIATCVTKDIRKLNKMLPVGVNVVMVNNQKIKIIKLK